MNSTVSQFKKYRESLTLEKDREDRIWDVVNSKLDSSKFVSSIENIEYSKFSYVNFMKGSLKFFLVIFVITFVISVPTYFISQGIELSKDRNFNLISDSSVNKVPVEEDTTDDLTFSSESTKQYAPDNSYDAMYSVEPGLEIMAMPAIDGGFGTDNDTEEEDRVKDVDANLKYKVVNMWEIVEKVNRIIEENNSYTTSINTSTKYSTFVIKVPVDRFDTVLNELRGLAVEIEQESINSRDRQNEYASTKSNIETLKDEIKALEEQLSKAVNQVDKDRINIELEGKRFTLSQYEVQSETIKKETDFATIYLKLEEDDTASNSDIMEALEGTWASIKGVFVTWIRILLFALVILLAISPVVIPVYLLIRASMNKKKESGQKNVVHKD